MDRAVPHHDFWKRFVAPVLTVVPTLLLTGRYLKV